MPHELISMRIPPALKAWLEWAHSIGFSGRLVALGK
jgi:hypothetical protein